MLNSKRKCVLLLKQGQGCPTPHLTYITPCRDVGLVSGVEVLDVYRRGTVAVHFLAGELQPGSVVRQSLDWNRRFDNMQQHSGVQYPPYLLCLYFF